VLRTYRAVLALLIPVLLTFFSSCGREGPDPGELSVVSTPDNAAISLNGQSTGEFTPHVFTEVPGGLAYQVSVSLAEHATRELEVNVNYGQRATASFTLMSIYGDLLVTSEPVGAAITLDGVETGEVTPHTFHVLSGTHLVSVALAGFAAFPAESSVDLPLAGQAEAGFTLSQQTGDLVVTSTPPGATIWIDGTNTGQVTPHTFVDMPVGSYLVSIVLAGYAPSPGDRTVSVTDDGTAAADYTLSLLAVPRIVLLEGFSNVHCTGCPQFSANVFSLQQQADYGPDVVLFLKWVGDVPSPLDPFYRDAQLVMDARMSYYDPNGSFNHPTLFVDGSLAGGYGTPPDVAGMQEAVSGDTGTADFLLDVASPDLTGLTIQATVQLVAPDAVDLTGCVLNVVLIYEEVTTARAYQGVRVFHDVVRDHVIAAADLGPLAAGTHDFPVTLNDPDPSANPYTLLTPNGKAVVAFVQRPDRTVVQAGSTMTESLTARPSGSLVSSLKLNRR
jgi:hypothetical protein